MAEFPHRPTTPADALAELLAGNDRFVAGTRIHPHQDAEHRTAVAAGQRPFAVLFGCSDSRLAAEIIFDRGLGDLFVVRTAGHTVGAEVVASIEYGVTVLEAPLVVVLGHDSCGAIEAGHAAMGGDNSIGDGLRAIVDRVIPSIEAAHRQGITDRDRIADVHVRRTIDTVVGRSTAIAERTAAGQCAVVGMSYRLTDGRVTVIAGGVPAPDGAPPRLPVGADPRT